MMFDTKLMFFDGDAHNAASDEVDLGPSPGNLVHPIQIWFDGNAVTTGGTISLDIQTASAQGGAYTSVALFAGLTAAQINSGFRIALAHVTGAKRWCKIVVTGTTGGTITSGIVMGTQSAR